MKKAKGKSESQSFIIKAAPSSLLILTFYFALLRGSVANS
jgi:hypothetical protein